MLFEVDTQSTDVVINSLVLICADQIRSATVFGISKDRAMLRFPILAMYLPPILDGGSTLHRASVAQVGRFDDAMLIERLDDRRRTPATGVQAERDSRLGERIKEVDNDLRICKRYHGQGHIDWRGRFVEVVNIPLVD